MEESYVLQLSDRKFTDMYLCHCGYAHCEPNHSFGPSVRPHFLIHYIIKGGGIYRVGKKEYRLKAGQGFLIEPEIQTYYQADKADPWTYVWIGFDGNNVRNYLNDMGLNQDHPIFECAYGEKLKQIVLEMLKNNISTTTNRFLLQGLLYEYFSVLTRDLRINAPLLQNGENPYVMQAIEFIQNNYSFPIHITDIASYVCINRSYLYTLFKSNLGVSPQDYLTNYRISRATELLSLTNLSIESIALSCGYTDPLIFSKVFKSRKGLTPSQYRKTDREKNKANLNSNIGNLDRL